jgi:hypothetical protein
VGLRLAAIGVLASLLYVPWALNLTQARIAVTGQYLVQSGSQSAFHRGEYNLIGDLTIYVPWWLLAVSAGALVWRSYRRQLAVWAMVLWVGGLLILANPYVLNLPGTGLVNNFAVFIALYIPAGVLAGVGVGDLSTVLRRWGRWGQMLWVVLILVCLGWGFGQRVRDLRPEHALLTGADLDAMDWIRSNTPPTSRFLVNGFAAYGATSVAGADAGWWIPLMTGRASTVPPLVCGAEMPLEADDCLKPLEIVSRLGEVPVTSAEGLAFLQGEGVTHVYIGQGNGEVGNPGDPLLDLDLLLESPHYRPVYHRDGVWVFELAFE